MSTAKTRDKLALVIGINDYQTVNRLEHSENDARDMTVALKKIHFDVQECLNPTYTDMKRSLETFIESIKLSDMILLYFSGHGLQWEVCSIIYFWACNRIKIYFRIKTI